MGSVTMNGFTCVNDNGDSAIVYTKLQTMPLCPKCNAIGLSSLCTSVCAKSQVWWVIPKVELGEERVKGNQNPHVKLRLKNSMKSLNGIGEKFETIHVIRKLELFEIGKVGLFEM